MGWFAANPDHPLSVIHSLFEKKFANTVGKGGQQSIRKVYIELKRAPFGLRYNALSAFVLGYCLRDILQKSYQWTNGQFTYPLDPDTLAEIIESVVKDDGKDGLGTKEKLICRLSREEKEFIEKLPGIFGATPNADATVESVLSQIQGRVEAISAKVPLWVLPEFVHAANEPKADKIEAVLNNVCTAFTTSSKGKVEVVKQLFFDHTKSESLLILKSKLNDVDIEDKDLHNILNTMLGGFGLDEITFMNNLRVKIDEFAIQSVVLKIKEEWIRISATGTPAEWAINNGIPARLIFGSHPDTSDLLKTIEQPETFAAAKLSDMLEILKEIKATSIADCQKSFIADVVPARYKKFEISLASLLEFLCSEHGKQPNYWPLRPDISEFIKRQYRGTIAPQIKEKIREENAESLKQKILRFADDNPELGLLFWEG